MECMNVLALCVLSFASGIYAKRRPNIIFFLADDFGYGDLSSYGHPTQEPGPIDKLAHEGLRFTQMYSTSVYCTPSRSTILTGRLTLRNGMYGDNIVSMPCMLGGLSKAEITIPEALKEGGYSTGMVGKWHLGINEAVYNDGKHLPYNYGFDYVGTMLPHTLVWRCDTTKTHMDKPHGSHCFIYYNDTIIQQPIHLENLTSSLLLDAKAFLYDSAEKDKPFFLYVSLPQTHTPMFNHPRFSGKSRRGVYGDQVNEMSWLVGELMDTVRELGMYDDTLTVFASDHGPHLEICAEGGDQGPFKGGKGFFQEGGIRVPVIMHWPGTILAGSVSTTVTSLMDIYSTFLSVALVDIPSDRVIDAKDLTYLFSEPGAPSPHQILFFYRLEELIAVRYKQYKVYLKHVPENIDYVKQINCGEGGFPRANIMGGMDKAVPYEVPVIYNVEKDPREEHVLMNPPQDVIADVQRLVDEHKASLVTREPVLMIETCHRKHIPCCNPPYCVCNFKRNL